MNYHFQTLIQTRQKSYAIHMNQMKAFVSLPLPLIKMFETKFGTERKKKELLRNMIIL
jgi:hypothetical protein